MLSVMRALVSLLVVGCIATALTSCGGDAGSNAPGGEADLTAVATTTQVADLVANVGGARVDVQGILPAGGDPHAFEPRPSDAASLTDTPVVFKSGGDLDGWLDELLDNVGADADVVSLIDHVHTIQGGEEHAGEGIDPHWWQDPRNAILAVAAVRDALTEVDPEGRDAYRRNAAAYTRRLRRLDSEIAACIAQVPAGQRKLVTTHDALGYFADRYDVEVVGALIPSLSTQAQPSVEDINALVGQIRHEGVRAIFPETAINNKLEQAVSREADAEVGKPLWADSLGPEGSTGDTYLKAMAFNTEAMVDGMTAGAVTCRPKA
jgi:ABC-type Zn uptake system ZnuABC Zn-binding protein ZnuA